MSTACLALGLILSGFLLGQPSPSLGDRLTLVEADHLPLQDLSGVLLELELKRHSSEALALAYYQPIDASLRRLADPAGSPPQPQLWLRQGLQASPPSGATGEKLIKTVGGQTVLALIEATPDVTEAVSYSLLLARLHRRFEREAPFGRVVKRRASKAFGTPPDVLQEDTGGESNSAAVEELAAEYLMASASFGAHLVMVANDIERAHRRRLSQGRVGLCSQLEANAGLFGLWTKAFEADFFPVTTFAADGSERTRNVRKQDRNWVLETLLPSSGWIGETLVDHQEYCDSRGSSP